MLPYLSEVRLFAFPFLPRGWVECNGQLLPISQNQALFALLGTQFGGDGRTSFAVPDLRGRVPTGFGQGDFQGSQYRMIGDAYGTESVTLGSTEMPMHDHQRTMANVQTSDRPQGNAPAPGGVYGAESGQFAAPTSAAGQSQAHPNMQPSLVLRYLMATSGIFPTRS